MEAYREIYPEAFISKHLEHNVRPDGRGLDGVRATVMSKDNVTSSVVLGSSFVKQGRTTVVGGVSGLVGPVSALGEGDLITCQVELSPLCDGQRPGLPRATALFLKEKLTQVLREAVPRERLLVEGASEAHVWSLHIDLYCVDDDGSVLDALFLAAMVALGSTRLPRLAFNAQTEKFEAMPSFETLSVARTSVALTFAMVGEWLVADPNHEEEAVASGLLTVVCNSDGSLACVEKRGGTPLARSVIEKCIKATQQRLKAIEPKIQHTWNE